MKRFFTPVALALFDTYGLRGTVVFHTVKMYVETGDFLEAVWCFHELSIAQKLNVASYLKKKNGGGGKRVASFCAIFIIRFLPGNGFSFDKRTHRRRSKN